MIFRKQNQTQGEGDKLKMNAADFDKLSETEKRTLLSVLRMRSVWGQKCE
jgi:hypothetical protein